MLKLGGYCQRNGEVIPAASWLPLGSAAECCPSSTASSLRVQSRHHWNQEELESLKRAEQQPQPFVMFGHSRVTSLSPGPAPWAACVHGFPRVSGPRIEEAVRSLVAKPLLFSNLKAGRSKALHSG